MWLKAFQSKGKLLSETEFWVLTLVDNQFEQPSEIMERLMLQTNEWTPKPGTVYPILHRLAEANLLDKTEEDSLQFRRSKQGDVFLSSIAKPLRVQVVESCNFYYQILQNLSTIDTPPVRFPEILIQLSGLARNFSEQLVQLAKEVKERQDKAYDVPISFDE